MSLLLIELAGLILFVHLRLFMAQLCALIRMKMVQKFVRNLLLAKKI